MQSESSGASASFQTLSPRLHVSLKLDRLRSFHIPETDVEAASEQDAGEGESPYRPPEITTLFSVSARLEPLFVDANKRWVCAFVPLWVCCSS